MKITINDLGPISVFEYDLKKKVTFIFGSNSVGKSYAISTVYLILKNLNLVFKGFENQYLYSNYFHIKGYPRYQIGATKLKGVEQILKVLKTTETEKDITKIAELACKHSLEEYFCEAFGKSLETSFGSLASISNYNSNETFSIKFDSSDLEFVIGLNENKSKVEIRSLKIKHPIILRKAKTFRDSFRDSNGNEIFYFNENIDFEELSPGLIFSLTTKTLSSFNENLRSYVKGVYFFPASRSGLYQALSTFSAVIAELSQSRNFLRNKIELPNIPEQVSDYFLDLSSIDSKMKVSEDAERIACVFEEKILGGRVEFDSDSKKLYFRPLNKDVLLELMATSSMVSEIAPIVAFLKFILFKSRSKTKRQVLIFIEEPEAHLHPENQVKFLENFLSLINENIRLVITSHSNYMFNKLNNLIINNDFNSSDVATCLVKNGERGSISDYESMKVTEDGIIDENFLKVSEDLFNELANPD